MRPGLGCEQYSVPNSGGNGGSNNVLGTGPQNPAVMGTNAGMMSMMGGAPMPPYPAAGQPFFGFVDPSSMMVFPDHDRGHPMGGNGGLGGGGAAGNRNSRRRRRNRGKRGAGGGQNGNENNHHHPRHHDNNNNNNNNNNDEDYAGGVGGRRPTRSLWIGNIDDMLTEEALHNIFRPYGPIESVRILRDKDCAFVNYARVEDAIVAVGNTHGLTVGETTIKVGFGRSDGALGDRPSSSLWVGNIDDDVTEKVGHACGCVCVCVCLCLFEVRMSCIWMAGVFFIYIFIVRVFCFLFSLSTHSQSPTLSHNVWRNRRCFVSLSRMERF